MTRTSVILSYRLIDTLIYLGPILTYGLNHTNDIKISTGGNTISKISSNKVTSYSLGVEAGVKFLLWSVGLEAGTMGMQYKDATDSYNTALVKDLDMSGAYTKLFVGFGF